MNIAHEVSMAQDTAICQSPSIFELRRERERAEMTDRIMEVAREMFVRDGYEAVTLRKISLAIEYSQGTIYKYFKDKQALVMAIIRKDTQDVRKSLLECLALENPIEQLIEMARRYAAWGIAHPNHYRLIYTPQPAWVEQDREMHLQEPLPLEQEVLFVLNAVIKEAMRRGLFKEKYTEPGLVAATLWAGIHGAVLLEINMTPQDRVFLEVKDTSFETRFNTLKEAFLDGFLKDEYRSGRSRE
jgi:AcrR family transcriptional regulator